MNPNNPGATRRDPLQSAQQQLGLVLSFFPRVDTLLAALLGVNLAMLGVAFARAPAVTAFTSLQVACAGLYLALAIMSLRHLYLGSFPNTDGGVGSLVYFKEIAKLEPKDFVSRFGDQSDSELTEALLHQAWRNSCILSQKFAALKAAYRWLLTATAPWVVLLLMLPPTKGA